MTYNPYPSIRDELDTACLQAFSKSDEVITSIEISYDGLDSLIATDPSHMHHVAFGDIRWRSIPIKPMDGFLKGGTQYRLVTRPLKPSEAGHTIRGKLP